MDCRQIKNKIIACCDDLTSFSSHKDVSSHLNICEDCNREYQLTIEENEALRYTDDIPCLSPAFTAMIMDSLKLESSINVEPVLAQRPTGMHGSTKRRLWAGAAVTTAAVAAIVVCLHWPQLYGKNGADLAFYEMTAPEQHVYDMNIYNGYPPTPALTGLDLGAGTINTETIANPEQPPHAGLPETPLIPAAKPDKEKSSLPPQQPVRTLSMAKQDSAVDTETLAADNIKSFDSLYSYSQVTPEYNPLADLPSRSQEPIMMKSSPANVSQANETVNIIAFSPPNPLNGLQLVQFSTGSGQDTYDYTSADGKQSVRLTLSPCVQVSLNATSLYDTQSSVPSITRLIQMGNWQFELNCSGNLHSEELVALANTVQTRAEENK